MLIAGRNHMTINELVEGAIIRFVAGKHVKVGGIGFEHRKVESYGFAIFAYDLKSGQTKIVGVAPGGGEVKTQTLKNNNITMITGVMNF